MRTTSYAPECSSSSIYTYSLPQCDGWMNQGSMSCLENCVNNILPTGCSLEHDPCQYALETRNTVSGSFWNFWCHHAVECSFDALDNSATVFGPMTHLTTKDADGCSEVGIVVLFHNCHNYFQFLEIKPVALLIFVKVRPLCFFS